MTCTSCVAWMYLHEGTGTPAGAASIRRMIMEHYTLGSLEITYVNGGGKIPTYYDERV